MKKFTVLALGLVLIAAAFVGCEMATDQEDDSGTTGTLSVKLTDDPFPIDLVSEATVKIDSLVVREKVEQQEGNPFTTLSTEPATFNLLELQNGVTASLAELEIPVGEYDLLRLYVDSASVTLNNGDFYEVFVPSGAETGIKVFIDPAIPVEGDLTSELLLDLDVSKSFILRDNMDSPAGVTGFNFKPVIRATNLSTSGRIAGTVLDSTGNAVADAQVWAAQDTVVTNTFSDTDGTYALIGLPEGTYTASAIIHGDTVSVSGVDVVAANETEVDIQWPGGMEKIVSGSE